jgi:ABC-type transport system substrate-binding protein
MTQCSFNLNPVGAGPYMIDKFLPKESITLKRNAAYWGGKPHLDTIKFVTVGTSQGVLEGLKSGTLQMGYMREPEPGKIASEDSTLGTYLNLVWAGNGLILNNGKVNCKGGLPAAVCAGRPLLSTRTTSSRRRSSCRRSKPKASGTARCG